MTAKKNNRTRKKTNEELLIEGNKKLDIIARLLALNLPSTINQNQKILILDEMDLSPKEIAAILGTTSHVISVQLNKMKDKRRNKTGPEE